MKKCELRKIYIDKKGEISKRLGEFERIGKNWNEEDVFSELVFCLLTPQSRATVCWQCVLTLKKKGLLHKGSEEKVLKGLIGVRFKNKKSRFISAARESFKFFRPSGTNIQMREWLVRNIRGIGYKEASHFLRNIGYGQDIAILDRHILKGLKQFRIIDKIPSSLSRKKYLEIEEKMRRFAKRLGIPLIYLDFILWFKETGEIFK